MNEIDKNIMHFEAAQFPDTFMNVVNSLGFESPPGAPIGSDAHVLHDHTYCCQMFPN